MSFRDKNLDPIDLGAVVQWVAEAGRLALSFRNVRYDTAYKPDSTPTTAVDYAVEAFLLERIRTHYPAHQIMGEESGTSQDVHDVLWVIDPLDGTRAFASGLPIWGISVGILKQGQCCAGVFHMPAVGEQYWGSQDGAFCNGQLLQRLASAELDDRLMFLAVPSNAHLFYEISFPRLRSLGSTAAHLIYVALGSAVGALTRPIKIWDVAGVLPILEVAGIELRYLSGARFDIDDILHGESAREPLVAAHQDHIERVLDGIRLKVTAPVP